MTAPGQMVKPPKVTPPRVLSADHNTIELLVGDQVLGLLTQPAFQQAWESLYRCCPWATVFQSPAFVTTWYQSYQAHYLPLVLRGMSAGRLTGLLTLARKDNGLIVGAGDSQAEYQVWLAPDTPNDAFLGPALDLLRRHFPGQEIRLKYLPALAPREWITGHKTWNRRCLLRPYPQPLLTLREEQLSQELRKKNRREKLSRLRRLGKLSLERVSDGQAFAAIFDELATQYDFRKGAMFNKLFFRDDPQRKPFLLALFEQGLLHVTVLKLNEEIIAANVGAAGRSWVHLQGLNTHAPQYARYSPGILHFLLLGKLLAEEGYTVFDLTPGADAYKQSLATDYVTAYELRIGNAYRKLASQIKYKLVKCIKSSASRLGLKPQRIKKLKKDISVIKERIKDPGQEGLVPFIKGLISQVRLRKTNLLFRICPEVVRNHSDPAVTIKQGSLPDLLQFHQEGSKLGRWDFLADAMRRLESGERAYTWSEEGKLLGCAWLRGWEPTPLKDPQNKERNQIWPVIQGISYHPKGGDSRTAFLAGVAREVMKKEKVEKVYALVEKGDAVIGQSLKAMGAREDSVIRNPL
jgi:CelD/BcsL family acetyltransferase involved in cellulose biosynthesis